MIADRVAEVGDRLTPAERQVAEVLVAEPSRIAFGTVASLAEHAGTSGPTVVRLAVKLGFDGFGDLQAAVQEELSGRLRPAVERIRAAPAATPLERALDLETENVQATLRGADSGSFADAVRLLADRKRTVFVVAGESTAGVAAQFTDALDLLRDRVRPLRGSDVAVARSMAFLRPGDVVVAIEVRRYERWVVDAVERALQCGAELIALTDSPLSPLARGATATFILAAEGPGPFDSHVGTLALLNALVAGVADRVRSAAASRLEGVEAATAPRLQD